MISSVQTAPVVRESAICPSPARARLSGVEVATTEIETPLGTLVASCTEQGISRLEFADAPRATSEHAVRAHPHLERLRVDLHAYFSGELQQFTHPLDAAGTPFQARVWAELARIPHGKTCSYESIAQRIGQPTATRAVARANALNPVCLLVPCHRVIAKDGSLSGYAGGVWRKHALLALERDGALPAARGPV